MIINLFEILLRFCEKFNDMKRIDSNQQTNEKKKTKKQRNPNQTKKPKKQYFILQYNNLLYFN